MSPSNDMMALKKLCEKRNSKMKKHDVFISYKSEDFQVADWVRSVLETNRISCWMAPADIPGGSSYAAEIPAAISSCRVFVLIMSRKAQNSTWVPKELDLAVNGEKIVMPFMLEDLKLRDDFNFYLSNVQRYAAYENKTRAMQKMVREIQAVLGVGREEDAYAGQGENTAAGNGRKPSGKKRIIAACCAAALVLAVALAAVFLLNKEKNDGSEIPAETAPAADEITEPYHITLNPSDKVSAKQNSEAKKRLRERLDIFTGGEEYRWEEDDEDRIELYLPRKAFAGHSVEKILRCYLTRAIRIYMVDLDQKGTLIPLERSDLESVEKKTGSISGTDVSTLGITETEYDYIEIRLADAFVQEHQAEYETWSRLAFAQDVEENPDIYYYHYTFPAGDGKTFYVVNTDQGGQFTDLVIYNLKHDSLFDGFRFAIDTNSWAKWEDPEKTDARGANQQKYDSFETGTMTFTIRLAREITAGELLDTQTGLKQRLDALERPYAIGLIETDTKETLLAVKMPPDRLGTVIMQFLSGTGSFSVRTNTLEVGYSLTNMAVEKKGEHVFEIIPDRYYAKDLQLMALTAGKKGEEYCYICKGAQPLLAVGLDELAESGRMIVSGICELKDEQVVQIPVDETNEWYLKLVEAVNKTNRSFKSLELYNLQMNPGPDGSVPTLENFGVRMEPDAAGIQAIAGKIHPGAEVYYNQDWELVIELNLLPEGESFPEQALALAQGIYEALEMENRFSSRICVYLADEDEASGENAHLVFRKKRGTKTRDEDGNEIFSDCYCYVFGYLGRGRIAVHLDQFRELVARSAFWQGFPESDSRWYYYPEGK